MGGQACAMPIGPTPQGRFDLFAPGRFFGPGHQAVGFTESMLGYALPRQAALHSASRQERARTDATALRIAAAARQHQPLARGIGDDRKVAAIDLFYRITVGPRCGDGMLWPNRGIGPT